MVVVVVVVVVVVAVVVVAVVVVVVVVIEFGRCPNIWSETCEIRDLGPKSWIDREYAYRPYCF